MLKVKMTESDNFWMITLKLVLLILNLKSKILNPSFSNQIKLRTKVVREMMIKYRIHQDTHESSKSLKCPLKILKERISWQPKTN